VCRNIKKEYSITPCEICNIANLSPRYHFLRRRTFLGWSSPKTTNVCLPSVYARAIRKQIVALPGIDISRSRRIQSLTLHRGGGGERAGEGGGRRRGGEGAGTAFDVIAPRASLPLVHVLWLLVEHVCGPSFVLLRAFGSFPASLLGDLSNTWCERGERAPCRVALLRKSFQLVRPASCFAKYEKHPREFLHWYYTEEDL